MTLLLTDQYEVRHLLLVNALVRDELWGTMVALNGTEIAHVGFDAALGNLKRVPQHRYDEAKVLFGR